MDTAVRGSCGVTPLRGERAQGFTFVEVLAASLILSVVVGGTMSAFVTAARIMARQENPQTAEANYYAQQTIERFRNRIACDDAWFDPAACLVNPAMILSTWTSDDLPPSGGSESILSIILPSRARRCYRVMPVLNCGGPPTYPDCLTIQARVCWNDMSTCPCPPS